MMIQKRKICEKSDHISRLRQIMKKYYHFDKDLFMKMIDFKQACCIIDKKHL